MAVARLQRLDWPIEKAVQRHGFAPSPTSPLDQPIHVGTAARARRAAAKHRCTSMSPSPSVRLKTRIGRAGRLPFRPSEAPAADSGRSPGTAQRGRSRQGRSPGNVRDRVGDYSDAVRSGCLQGLLQPVGRPAIAQTCTAKSGTVAASSTWALSMGPKVFGPVGRWPAPGGRDHRSGVHQHRVA